MRTLSEFAADYDLIGITLLSHQMIPRARQVVERLKQTSRAPVVIGGPPVICEPEYFLNIADNVGLGEGEKTLLEMFKCLEQGKPFDDVPNLGYRLNESEIKLNPLVSLLDLQSYPVCKLELDHNYIVEEEAVTIRERADLLQSATRARGYPVFSIRGCPFTCTYCANNAIKKRYEGCGKYVRSYSIEAIIQEMEHAKSILSNIGEVKFDDDDFFARPRPEIQELADKYAGRVGIPCWVNARIESITEERLDMVLRAGMPLIGVKIGLQSGSEHTCEEIYKRRLNVEQFKKRLALLAKNNIAAMIDTIWDNPFETGQDRAATPKVVYELVRDVYSPEDLKKGLLTIFNHRLMYYPGTELYDMALKAGYIDESYMEEVLFSRSYRASGDKVYGDLGSDFLVTRFANLRRAPLVAKWGLFALSQPSVYALMDSAFGKASLRTAYRTLKGARDLAKKALRPGR